jgi:hypothetical protein
LTGACARELPPKGPVRNHPLTGHIEGIMESTQLTQTGNPADTLLDGSSK